MWLIVAISSYFINAGVYVADKFLLSKKIHSSVAYSFFVGIWSIFNFFILIFDPWVPNFQEFILDISAGFLFLLTLIFWYKALHQSEATRVVPLVGALVPIFSLVLSAIFLGEVLDKEHLIAFFILIAGGLMISVKHTRMHLFHEVLYKIRNIFGDFLGDTHANYRPTRRLIINAFVSAFCFAAYYVLMKHIYIEQPFIGGFVWSRLGTFLGVLLIIAVPYWRSLVLQKRRETKKTSSLSFFLLVRFLAAIAFIMLNWAISLGNVAMVHALQGTQYLFLIFLVLLLSVKFPKIMKEELGRGVMLQKALGVVLVSLGLYMLIS